MATCTFCGSQLTVGTGKMYVQKDSKILWFCSRRCEKNLLKLHRIPRETSFTVEGKKYKAQRMAAAAHDSKHKSEAEHAPAATAAAKPAAKKTTKPAAKKAAKSASEE